MVSRLAIDHVRSARVRRERYVGAWLPEPLVATVEQDPGELAVLNEALSTAFLLLLESLSPTERAVFLLRQVFGYGYPEIAAICGKTEANCRQIFHRAQRRMAEGRPRFAVDAAQAESAARALVRACTSGDVDQVIAMLAPDVVAVADGGGVVNAALRPIQGAEQVARYLLGLTRLVGSAITIHGAMVNGEPGVVVYDHGHPVGVITFQIMGGQIAQVYLLVNPEKLQAVPAADRLAPPSKRGGVPPDLHG